MEWTRYQRSETQARAIYRLQAMTIDRLVNLKESVEHWETIKSMLEARESTLLTIENNKEILDKVDVALSRKFRRLTDIAVGEVFDIEGALADIERSIERVMRITGCEFVPRLYNPVTIRSLYNEGKIEQ